MTITGAQVRMARAALQWDVRDLAEKALISPTMVTAVEAEEDIGAAARMVLRRAFETAGIEFIGENGGGPGVRLKRQRPPVRRM
jgi:ribosome-binding protein aMBF1 (putative translation factor)